MRVIADHMRACTFLIADGVIPSNEWRGYVLRKIMRRAMRHGKKLGITQPFMHELADRVVTEMGDAYPELKANRDSVVSVIRSEEERFDAVLTTGLGRLEQVLERAAASERKVVPGDEMFRLYDSLGLPLDFIEDLASERQLAVDRAGYEAAMEAQRERARAGSHFEMARTQGFTVQRAGHAGRARCPRRSLRRLRHHRADRRDDRRAVRRHTQRSVRPRCRRHRLRRARSHAVLRRKRRPGVRHGHADGPGRVAPMCRRCPGSRRVDHACIRSPSRRARCARAPSSRRASTSARRTAIRRNHTATHLLHAALRQTLGHAREAGRLARRARSPAVRLRAHRHDRRERPRGHRAHREHADHAQHEGADDAAPDRRGDGTRGDGAVRREVRRHGARRRHPGIQSRAVRRYALPRHRRHRRLHHRQRRRRGRGCPSSRGGDRRGRGRACCRTNDGSCRRSRPNCT